MLTFEDRDVGSKQAGKRSGVCGKKDWRGD
jgi:hypothetical protein